MLFLALLTLLVTIIAAFYLIYKPPSLLIKFFEYQWPDVLWRISTSEKIVALTIDDAPSEYTSQVLDILEENDAFATFFVIGSQVPGREEILEEIVRNGNELGNHAMHDEPSRSLSDDELKGQIMTVEESIRKAYDSLNMAPPPRYFRPGSGFFSTRMRQLLSTLKYRIVLGNIYPHDPQIPYANVNARHILSMLRPGSIIICHDRRSWTIPMLKKVVPEIKGRGYRIVTISGLLDHQIKEREAQYPKLEDPEDGDGIRIES
ncbi:nodulation protein nodB [Westerdykella ornata]|uniref:chitin deacetylase n=1 Tax=Westerdykella ornata TaxID=318751 RepID=A0A6A6JAD2_WESOR|nr:nodulation protein nodB [Westerdykella ornata]KAF2273217.1 nodulation protein nodB [Westerdykella ornata]